LRFHSLWYGVVNPAVISSHVGIWNSVFDLFWQTGQTSDQSLGLAVKFKVGIISGYYTGNPSLPANQRTRGDFKCGQEIKGEDVLLLVDWTFPNITSLAGFTLDLRGILPAGLHLSQGF